jgi:hypothetical protein
VRSRLRMPGRCGVLPGARGATCPIPQPPAVRALDANRSARAIVLNEGLAVPSLWSRTRCAKEVHMSPEPTPESLAALAASILVRPRERQALTLELETAVAEIPEPPPPQFPAS